MTGGWCQLKMKWKQAIITLRNKDGFAEFANKNLLSSIILMEYCQMHRCLQQVPNQRYLGLHHYTAFLRQITTLIFGWLNFSPFLCHHFFFLNNSDQDMFKYRVENNNNLCLMYGMVMGFAWALQFLSWHLILSFCTLCWLACFSHPFPDTTRYISKHPELYTWPLHLHILYMLNFCTFPQHFFPPCTKPYRVLQGLIFVFKMIYTYILCLSQ